MRVGLLFLFAFLSLTLVSAEVWLAQHSALNVFKARVVRCFDGNTCRFSLVGLHPVLGASVLVHVKGLQTPKMRKPTLDAARSARDALRRLLTQGERVFLVRAGRKNGGLVADVCVDGVDAAAWLAKQGLGRLDAMRNFLNCGRSLALSAFMARLMLWLPQFRQAFLWVIGGAALAVLCWRGSSFALIAFLDFSADAGTEWRRVGGLGGVFGFANAALKKAHEEKERGTKGYFLHAPSRMAGLLAVRRLQANGFTASLNGDTLAVWWP